MVNAFPIDFFFENIRLENHSMEIAELKSKNFLTTRQLTTGAV